MHQAQQHQWRRHHEYAHYAACLLRYGYGKENAVLIRSHSIFACIDDNHEIEIGEPDVHVVSA